VAASDHPDSLASRGNLAGAYQDAGDLSRATPCISLALAESVRVLGEDHPRPRWCVATSPRRASNLSSGPRMARTDLGGAALSAL